MIMAVINAIEIKSLTKKFKSAVVLDDVSLSFESKKIHGLIGRNGAGKTMLLKCICGFVIPDKGTITVEGKKVGKDCDVPGNLGIIIETPGFLPNYDGFANLKFLAVIKNKISNQKIRDTIAYVGLDPNSKKHVGKYSLGMRQRLGLAQAIMEDPDILILDEPMNGLDNQGVQDIRNLLLQMREDGKTIILASHSKEDIAVLCDYTYEMDHGKIISFNKSEK